MFSDSSPAPLNEITSPDSAISETAQPALDLLNEPANEPQVPQENPLDFDQDFDKLVLTRGQDFDLDYTLLGLFQYFIRFIYVFLVPVMRANERQQLDLKGCQPGESIVPIDMLNDPDNHRLWQDSLITEPSGQQRLSCKYPHGLDLWDVNRQILFVGFEPTQTDLFIYQNRKQLSVFCRSSTNMPEHDEYAQHAPIGQRDISYARRGPVTERVITERHTQNRQ